MQVYIYIYLYGIYYILWDMATIPEKKQTVEEGGGGVEDIEFPVVN